MDSDAAHLPPEAPDSAALKLVAQLAGLQNAPQVPLTVAGMFGQTIREWRTKNWLDEVEEAAAKLEARGIAPEQAKQLPVADLHRIFENGSKVDDPKLKSFWASLLANSADPGKSISPRPVLTETLNRLGPLEAQLLEFLWLIPSFEDEYRAEVKAIVKEKGPGAQGLFPAEKRLRERVAHHLQIATKGYTSGDVQTSISLLIHDDLISPNVQTQQFQGGTPFSAPIGQRIEQHIDPNALARALNDMIKRGDLLLGRSEAKLPNLFEHGQLYYHLTPFGREVMDACH